MPSIFITGANRGLGLAIARHYVAHDWHVHASFREDHSLGELSQLQKQFPETLQLHKLDVRRGESIETVRKQLLGVPIDVLVNNAGVSIGRNDVFGELNYQAWSEVLDVNLLGAARVTETLIDNVYLGANKVIVFVSSDLASLTGHDGRPLYYYRTSKIALNILMRTVSFDLQSKGIIAFAFHPGWIRTDMGGERAIVIPEESVDGLANIINFADRSTSGRYFDWKGRSLEW